MSNSDTRSLGYFIVDATILVGVVVAVAISGSRYWLPREVSAHQAGIYVATSAVAATLLGFVIAAVTILLTIGGRRLTRTYVASPLYGKTLALFQQTAWWLAVGTVVSLAGLFVDQEPSDPAKHLGIATLWIWVVAGVGLIAVWRFFYVLWILKDVTNLVVTDARGPQRKAQAGDATAPF